MTELMIKMTSWLLVAMTLGFVVAWLLSRIIYKRRQGDKEDTFSAVILERNNMIDKLEKNFRTERIIFEKLSNELKDSKEALAEKTSLLTTLQNNLNNNRLNKDSSLALKEKNNLLFIKVQKLEQIDIKRVKELEDFEEIVLLAEEKVDESKKKYREIVKKLDDEIELLTLENEKNKTNITLYEKTIRYFEEELLLYKADSSAPEFIISKDQFIKIEEQLERYQKEIKILNNQNKDLCLKSKKSFNVSEKENDDSSMVKVFRETYKKITKS